MDTEKSLLIKILKNVNHNTYFQDILDCPTNKNNAKIAEYSKQALNKGKQLYLQKNHDAETHIQILDYYCQSISLAPLDDSELLAKAYGSRSAFLFHINKYEECIIDIDRALAIAKSDVLLIKLLSQKLEYMKKSALPNDQSVLANVENLASEVDEKNKTQIDALINEIKLCSSSNRKVPSNQSYLNDVFSQKDQPLDCVSIEYNEKYGRHLIAKKNYNPGDFIFRDKLHVTVLNSKLNYTNCNYCLKICWSGVACDYCSWAMFCSEECRNKAWNNFHYVECSEWYSQSRGLYFDDIRKSLRILLVGISEAGSIDQLKEKLKEVDQSKSDCCKNFDKYDQFKNSTIQSIYSLKGREISKINADALALNVLLILICIVKNGKLIRNIKLQKIDDIITNEDLVFLGSLLMRLTLISMNNIFSFSQMNCDCQQLKRADYKCCDRGSGLSTLASLLNHSCHPNAFRIFTEDRYINIYALQPIKKDSQIFVTYTGFYYDKRPEDRKEMLKNYNLTCDCEACIEFWPPLFLLPNYFDLINIQGPFEKRLYICCKNIFDALDVKQLDFSKKDIKKLCKTIVKANQCLKQPTVLMATLEDSLVRIYSRIYGWKSPIHVFGKCDVMQVTDSN